MADGVAALVALGLIVGFLRIWTAAFAGLAPRDAEAVPLLNVAALGTGIALGSAILLATRAPEAFLPSSIFTRDGPWAIGLGDFLRLHALPDTASLHAALQATLAGQGWAGLAGGGAALGLAGGAWCSMRLWRGLARVRAFAAFLLMAAGVAWLLHYGAHLFAWAAAQMSFWLFLAMLWGFQHWRYRARAAH